jgi:hypothetical protein
VLAFEAIILVDNFQKGICQLRSWSYGHTGSTSIEDYHFFFSVVEHKLGITEKVKENYLDGQVLTQSNELNCTQFVQPQGSISAVNL